MAKREGLEQINVRVKSESYDALEAAAYVRRIRSLQELLNPFIEELASKLAKEPEVQVAIRARKEYVARESGSLSHMRRQTKRKR